MVKWALSLFIAVCGDKKEDGRDEHGFEGQNSLNINESHWRQMNLDSQSPSYSNAAFLV
jgi:hypothetical protein